MTAALLATALAAAARRRTRIVVGTLSDPASLAPHRATDLVAAEIVANVCETLVRMRPGSLRPEGVLATAWATPDQRVWTCHAARGSARSTTAPRSTPTRSSRTSSTCAASAASRAAPSASGPHVVEITLDRPNAALLSTLSQPFFAMQSPRAARRHAGGAGRHRPLPAGGGAGRARSSSSAFASTGPAPRACGASCSAASRTRTRSPGRWPAARRTSPRRSAPSRAAELRTHAGRDARRAGRAQPHLPGRQQRAQPLLGRARAARALARDRPRRARARAARRARRAGARGPAAGCSSATTRARASWCSTGTRPGACWPTRACPRASRRRSRSRAPRAPTCSSRCASRRASATTSPASGLAVRLREVASWAEHVALTSRGDFELALLGWQADTLDPNDFLTALLDSGLDRHHEPQPLPQRRHGRPAEARPPGQRPGARLAALPPGAGAVPERHAVRPALPLVRVHRPPPRGARPRDRPHRRR